ncbi:cytochrome b5 domain-containing protein [Candidatus Woesebacteria bacterium]|nr:cytochrome b5 domain-containing protein [Candidatus Woesebacteria bacterium]
MNKYIIVVLVVIIIAIGAYAFLSSSSGAPAPTSITMNGVPTVAQNASQNSDASYTLSQVAQHNSANDCWFVISGKVYDVTSYIAQGMHPGGPSILEGCGTDATAMFEGQAGPRGEPHSQQAHAELVNFEVGTLMQ